MNLDLVRNEIKLLEAIIKALRKEQERTSSDHNMRRHEMLLKYLQIMEEYHTHLSKFLEDL